MFIHSMSVGQEVRKTGRQTFLEQCREQQSEDSDWRAAEQSVQRAEPEQLLLLAGSFTSCFQKYFSFHKIFCSNFFTSLKKYVVFQALEFFHSKNSTQVIARPPSQRPKKAQHVGDLKTP